MKMYFDPTSFHMYALFVGKYDKSFNLDETKQDQALIFSLNMTFLDFEIDTKLGYRIDEVDHAFQLYGYVYF